MKLMYDMHVHSQSSHDSVAPVLEVAKSCYEKGIGAFAVTDHCDIQYFNPNVVESSILEAEQAAKEYEGKVKVLMGIEIGEAIWDEDTAKSILSKYDYDVLISSVHAVRYGEYCDPYSTIDFSKMSEKQLDEYVKTYFDELLLMVSTIDFDIMAHLTCPFRYIVGKYGINLDTRKYEDQISKILDCIIEKNICMEINTSGVGTGFGTFMPDGWIIEKFKKKGGYLVSLGSDAHMPENVGKGFDKAIDLLKSLGFDGYYYFEKRKRIFVKA